MAKREVYECDICGREIRARQVWVITGTETNEGYGLEMYPEALSTPRDYVHEIACSKPCALGAVTKYLTENDVKEETKCSDA